MKCEGSIAYDILHGGDVVKNYTFMDEGQAAHKLGEWCFLNESSAMDYPRDTISWVDDLRGILFHDVDLDMRRGVDEYVSTVRAMADGDPIFVEQSVYVFDSPGGTSDVVILKAGELQVHDLKYGRRPVKAKHNPQLMLYGKGAHRLIDSLFGEAPDKVRLVIHQPKLRYVDEWLTDASTLTEHEDMARVKRDGIVTSVCMGESMDCDPGVSQCTYCDHKSRCLHLDKFVRMLMSDDVAGDTPLDADKIQAAVELAKTRSDNDRIASLLPHVELVEMWCKAVRTRARDEIMAGADIPGWKMVDGKTGNRSWRDMDLTVRTLKGMRLKKIQMYTEELKTPTQIEKEVGGEKYKKKLLNLVERKAGSPILVPVSNEKEAINYSKPIESFEDLGPQTPGEDSPSEIPAGMEDLL